MPELPEVETIRRDLAREIIGKKIVSVKVNKTKLVKSNLAKFKKTLRSTSFSDIFRIGKLMIFTLKDTPYFLLIHLKMTGQLIYLDKGKVIAGGHSWKNMSLELPNKYTHIIIEFKDKTKLFFNDLRQFGYWRIVDKKQKDQIVESYGIEPLKKNFTLAKFKQIIEKRRTTIKAVLTNQKLIAGIGNIYADEICFSAKIKPHRPANKLTDQEIKKLYRACNSIIKKAIDKRGTTFNSYVDAKGNKGNYNKYLKVYRKENNKCSRCKNSIIKKMKLNGRGTRYCPNCQK